MRVNEGGHNIPIETIVKRYKIGLINLFELYIPICDYWMVVNNSIRPFKLIAEGIKNKKIIINDTSIWNNIKYQKDE